MHIAIFGLGYVGLTAAGCLASQGHDILGIDVSSEKVSQLNLGKAPISEPGLDELIAQAVAKGTLRAVTSVGSALDEFDLAIVCVGTPSAPDGSHNMEFIAQVTQQIADAVLPSRKRPLTVAYRSTMRPGSMDNLIRPIFERALGTRMGSVELVYNPEFLRESVAIKDFFNPPKIVVGTTDGKRSETIDKLNEGLTAQVFYTDFRVAEITKFVDNTFHALKVSFANEIGRICVNLGISAARVHEIFVSDTKLNISPYYLRPGGAFGGSCLPKDVRALQYTSREIGADTEVINSLIVSNEAHKAFVFDYCTKGLKDDAKVLLVGLAFKANSDDLRESPNLDLAERLFAAGFDLRIFDDALNPENLIGKNLAYSKASKLDYQTLLISKAEASALEFDLVIDANGRLEKNAFRANKSVRLDALL